MSKVVRRPSFMGGGSARTGLTPPTGSAASLALGSSASLVGVSTRSLPGVGQMGVSSASLLDEPMTAPPMVQTPGAPPTPISARGNNSNSQNGMSLLLSPSTAGTNTPPQAVSTGAALTPRGAAAAINGGLPPPFVRASSMRGQLSRANSSRRVSIDAASVMDSDTSDADEDAKRERRRSSVLGIFNVDAEIKAVDRADDEMQGVGAAVTNSGHLVRLAARGAHKRTASTISISGNEHSQFNPLATLAGVRGPDGQPLPTATMAAPPLLGPGSKPGSVASGVGTSGDSIGIPGGGSSGAGTGSSNDSPQWINVDASGDQSVMAGTSLFCFGEENKLRILAFRTVSSRNFEWMIFFVIIISIVLLVLDVFDDSEASNASATIYSLTPDASANTWQVVQFYAAEATTLIFLIEAMLRITALGFVFNQHAYLRTGWNRLDFFVLAASLAVFFIGRDGDQFKFVKSFRVIRALRPLRMIRRLSGMRVVLTAIFRSLSKIVNVMVLNLFFYTIFGIIGVQLFAGLFHQCEDPLNDFYLMTGLNSTECVAQGYEWHNSARTGDFDHMGSALLELFEISSQEMWPDHMYRGMDCTSVNQSPSRSASPWNALFFIVWLIISNFFLNTLFLGVIVDTFQRMKNQLTGFGFLTLRQKAWLEVKKLFARAKTRVTEFLPPGGEAYPGVKYGCWMRGRRRTFAMVTHQYFEFVLAGIILLNVVQMCLPYEGQSVQYTDALLYSNYAFTAIFVVEVLVKWHGLGFQYFCSMWNLFDFSIATLSAWGSVYDLLHEGNLGIDSIFRVFRILRMFRVLHLKQLRGLRNLVQTLVFSLPAAINISSLMLLLFFVYATMGMALFGGMEYGDQISEQANFDTFPTAMLLLFRCSTGESWNGVMHDIMRRQPPSGLAVALAPPYFVTFIILGSFLMLNLFVAVIMEHFDNSGLTDQARGTLTMEDLKEFSKAWGHHAVQRSWWKFWADDDKWLPLNKLEAMLWEVKGPLGLADKNLSREDALMFIDSLDIPFYEREKEVDQHATAAAAGLFPTKPDSPTYGVNGSGIAGSAGNLFDSGTAYPEQDGDMQLYVHYLETMMAVVYRAFKDITSAQRRKELEKRDVPVPPVDNNSGSLPPSRPQTPTPPPPTAHHTMTPPPPTMALPPLATPTNNNGDDHYQYHDSPRDGSPPPPPGAGGAAATAAAAALASPTRSLSPPLPPPPPLSRASTWANLQATAAREREQAGTPPHLYRTTSPPMLTSTPNPAAIAVTAQRSGGHRRNSVTGSTGSGHGGAASILPNSPPVSTGGATRVHKHTGSTGSGGSGGGTHRGAHRSSTHHRSQSPPTASGYASDGGVTSGGHGTPRDRSGASAADGGSSSDEIDAIGDHLAVHKSITDDIRRRHSELLAANAPSAKDRADEKTGKRRSLKQALGSRFGKSKKRMSRVNPQLAGLAFQRLVHGMGSGGSGATSPPPVAHAATIHQLLLEQPIALSSPTHPVPIAAGRRPSHIAGHHGPLGGHAGGGLSISIPPRDPNSTQPPSALLSPPSGGMPPPPHPATPMTPSAYDTSGASASAAITPSPQTAGIPGLSRAASHHHISRSLTDPEGLARALQLGIQGHAAAAASGGLPPPRPRLGRRRSGFQTQLLM